MGQPASVIPAGGHASRSDNDGNGQLKKRVPIRLTDERWSHITEEHCELAGMRLDVLETIANPAAIYEGNDGEFLAVHEIEPGKSLVAVYRELAADGFIITAFLTRRIKSVERRSLLWPLPD